ncbi:MAG: hypothetical protein MJ238_01510 [Bacilli bacterium]|nr:hypothetical protein [Bacilli bacterium]
MNNVRKIINNVTIGLSIVCILFLSACNHILYVDVNISGIENYSPGLSSVLLCRYLTLRDEHNEHFLEEFSYESAFFQYKDRINGNVSHETVLMSLTYQETVFNQAFNNVKEKAGFSSRLEFTYKDYDFCLNETEEIINGKNHHTSFNLDGETKCIQWINLVGINNMKKEILFVGFFYANNEDVLKNINKSKPYSFSTWDNLFNTFFDEYTWS